MEQKIGKLDLVKTIANKTSHSQQTVSEVIDAVQEVIISEIMDNGNAVALPKLGTFKKKVNPARSGINPLNKKPIEISESHTIAFRPSSGVKRVIDTKKKKK